MREAEKTVSLLLTCFDEADCQVAFELEGATHVLRKGDAFEVEISGSGSGQVEISYEQGWIVVGAWSGARTRVRDRAGNRIPT